MRLHARFALSMALHSSPSEPFVLQLLEDIECAYRRAMRDHGIEQNARPGLRFRMDNKIH